MTTLDLKNRLAEIAFLVDTAVVPDDGYRYSLATFPAELNQLWCDTYMYGPVWER